MVPFWPCTMIRTFIAGPKVSREFIVEILLTGNTALVTQHWITTACPQGHVLRTTRPDEKADNRSRNVVLDNKQRLEQLVDTYAFDRIVYFSDYLTPHTEREGELDRLRRMLQANRERPVQIRSHPQSFHTAQPSWFHWRKRCFWTLPRNAAG